MSLNKKRWGIIPTVVLSLALMVSCSGKANTSNNNNGSMPQNPGNFKQADLYGEVKTINGNEITLSLLEMQQLGQFGPGGGNGQRQGNGGDMQNNNGNNNGKSNNNNSNGNNNDNNSNNNGNNGDSNTANNGGQNGNMKNRGNNPPQGGGFTREKKYTGETATIVVSSDTQITSFGMGRGNSEQEKLTVSDIKEGSIIQVWYKQDTGDKKEIERISVMPDFSQGNNNGTPPSNNGSGQNSTAASGS